MTPVDPLAGRRQAINENRASALTWPDKGRGCPVDVGDVFTLRSCSIEITRKERIRRKGQWLWMAQFVRHVHLPDRLNLLAAAGGYTEDEDRAMRAQDDPDPATIKTVHPMDNPLNLHTPPEPEAVPRDEIANYSSSRIAQQRYIREAAERRAAERRLPLSERIRRLEECDSVDLTRQFARIGQAVEAAEAKRCRLATTTKVPSDRAA